jgi:quercetin dioxygenase-like cupin family protein
MLRSPAHHFHENIGKDQKPMKIQPVAICLLSTAFLAPMAQALQTTGDVKATTLLKTSTSWNGAPLIYPKGQAEITAMTIEIRPGGQTGWHLHPVPSFGYMLQGELQVTLKDGKIKHLKAGDALAEVVSTLHNGRNVGKDTVKLVVFYAGTKGKGLTVKETVRPMQSMR